MLDYQIAQMEQIKNEVVIAAEADASIRRPLHHMRGDAGE
jgi:hypothetical protein